MSKAFTHKIREVVPFLKDVFNAYMTDHPDDFRSIFGEIARDYDLIEEVPFDPDDHEDFRGELEPGDDIEILTPHARVILA